MTDERVFRKIGPGLWMNVFDISKSDTVSRQIVVQPKNKNKNKRKTDIYRLTLPQFDISICAKIKKVRSLFFPRSVRRDGSAQPRNRTPCGNQSLDSN